MTDKSIAAPNDPAAPDGPDAHDLPTCNIVMKGGITSGVVYPLAVVELSKKYRFAGIGGTSAGAIAAALTAAAEKGREQGGFEKIAKVAEDLPHRMRGLFQPTPRHKPLFGVLMRLAVKQGGGRKALGVIGLVVAAYPGTAVLGALPALVLLALGWRLGSPLMAVVTAVLALVVFMALAFALRLKRIVTRELPESDFGLCPGIRQPGSTEDGLVDWLANLLDDVAAQPRDDATGAAKPLTFGDLDGDDPEQPAIALRMFTTCLSTGRPHVMPWSDASYNLYRYRPEELACLFPERIVRWMNDHSAADAADPAFRAMPPRKDLPVILPVRMSLSFPFLFSTVPLWMRDFTLGSLDAQKVLRRVRFSDGGMCSNLPLQLFDHMWPKCPTFAVALDPFSAERNVRGGVEKRVLLPSHANSGLLMPVEPIDTLREFVRSMMNVMQNWQDRLQATLPGYRDRIIHVYLKDEEGGLNLDMHPTVIAQLSELGRQAGHELVTRFDWPAHRWTRSVSAIDRLADAIGALDEETVAFIKDRPMGQTGYRQTVAWQRSAVAALNAIREIEEVRSGALAPPKPPNPVPQLRMTPRA